MLRHTKLLQILPKKFLLTGPPNRPQAKGSPETECILIIKLLHISHINISETTHQQIVQKCQHCSHCDLLTFCSV